MRIAYVCQDGGVPVFGAKGASVHVQEVLRELLARGASIDLYAACLGGDPPRWSDGVRVHGIGRPAGASVADREQSAVAADALVAERLESDGPFSLVYERHALWASAAMLYARRAQVPGILEINAPLIHEQARHRGLVHGDLAEGATRAAFGAAPVLVAVSRPVAQYVLDFPGTAGRVHVVPNGVRPERFDRVPPAIPREPGTFVVGFLGTLKPWHGIPLLLSTFRRLYADDPGMRLLVVGDGPERARIEAFAAGAGLADAVCVTGAVAPDKVPALLASMDAGIAPYPTDDDFYFSPLKVLEYMAAGLAVVVTPAGDLPTLVQDGVTGLVCRAADHRSLTDALRQLRRNPGMARRLGEAARIAARADHTWSARVDRMLELAGAARFAAPIEVRA